MWGEALAAARPHAKGRVKIFAIAAAIVAVLAAPAVPKAESTGTPLIRIPPAQIPSPAKATPAFQPVPQTLLPIDMPVLRDPDGSGIAMHGALTGNAESAVGVLLAILANSEVFDPSLSPPLVLADKADRHAQALFTATVRGAAVTGIAAAALSDAGGEIAVLYDDTESFAASFPRLRQALAQDDTAEIGRTDNSVCEADAFTRDYNADPSWQPVIAATAAPTSNTAGPPAEALASTLSSDTGQSWRIVPLLELQ
jgi:hypothetical protein